MWWASLEAPSDVIDFMEFLVSHFDDLNTPFLEIDGYTGNGQISLREFEEGVKNLKCSRFKGRNESARIANVFRFLDPSGEGQISRREWDILDFMWREMRQCTR